MRNFESDLFPFNYELEKQSNTESGSNYSCKLVRKTDKDEYKEKLRPRKRINYNEDLIEDYIKIEKHLRTNNSTLVVINQPNRLYTYIPPNLSYGSSTLPNTFEELQKLITFCDSQIKSLENEFFQTEDKDEGKARLKDVENLQVDPCLDQAIPISADVMTFDFPKLAATHKRLTGKLFDVVMMDPPWQIGSTNPTRGVTISYNTLSNKQIQSLNISCLQDEGFLFLWTINSRFCFSFSIMAEWGYKFCDAIYWIKQSVNGKILKSNGYYLQHSKEICLVGVKGEPWGKVHREVMVDCIFSKRRGQSQKPDEIYKMIETFIPNGHYIEIFGRRNNLRNGWITIGNEL